MFPQMGDTSADAEHSSLRSSSRRVSCWCVLLFIAGVGCGQQQTPTQAVNAPSARPTAITTRGSDVEQNSEIQLVVHNSPAGGDESSLSSSSVPAWAADAVFYQIFPERFCNGDKSNDPTRESLEVAGLGARELGDFAVDRRLVRPGRLGERSSGRISSRTACSIAATAAICRA